VEQDIADGKPVNPRIVEALGLTEVPKDDTIETSEPEAKAKVAPAGESKAENGGADGDPNTFPYEMHFINKKGIKTKKMMGEFTAERIEDIRENYRNKKIDVTIQRIK
jgi:hypothetical protein